MTCLAAKHPKFGVGDCYRLDLFWLNKNLCKKFQLMLRIFPGGKSAVCFASYNIFEHGGYI